jgi:hypothetical protein
MTFDSERRRFIQLAGLTTVGGLLWGCRPSGPPTPSFSSNALHTIDTTSRLMVDVHCHFFNGSDLPLAPFAVKVLEHSGDFPVWASSFAPLLQMVNWDLAPGFADEMNVLNQMSTVHREDGSELLRERRNEANKRGVIELQGKAKSLMSALGAGLDSSSGGLRALDQIDSLSGDYGKDVLGYINGNPAPIKLLNNSADYMAGIIFFLQLFQYRTTNLFTYLEMYSPGKTSQIDLVVPSLVDFNAWLVGIGGDGGTSINDQISILEKLAIVSGGRVHGMAPYDPLRNILDGGNTMKRVQDAVLNRGCMGIKIYPPMGFAPYCNAGIDAEHRPWKKNLVPGLPDVAYAPDFGAKLDQAMAELFDFCTSKDIPVLAHTSLSNGQTDSLQDLAGAFYWRKAAQQFKGLRVDFGHFGGSYPVADAKCQLAEGFMALMVEQGFGDGLFADTGYFLEVLTQQGALRDRIAQLIEESKGVVSSRLMYGTDWLMNCGVKGMGDYRNKFEQLATGIESYPGLAPGLRQRFGDKFFGLNAAGFLGLGKNQQTRKRLEKFYATHAVPPPTWMTKIDHTGSI